MPTRTKYGGEYSHRYGDTTLCQIHSDALWILTKATQALLIIPDVTPHERHVVVSAVAAAHRSLAKAQPAVTVPKTEEHGDGP